jgi:hypothetical protein
LVRGRLKLVTGFAADRLEIHNGVITVAGRAADGGIKLGPFDRIIVATGQRPDLTMTQELRLDLDPWLECPKALGPSIDPNLHCEGPQCPLLTQSGHRRPLFYSAVIRLGPSAAQSSDKL